jgi:hypothetical protein
MRISHIHCRLLGQDQRKKVLIKEKAVTENSLNCFQHFAMAADGPPYHADGPPVYSSEKC